MDVDGVEGCYCCGLRVRTDLYGVYPLMCG